MWGSDRTGNGNATMVSAIAPRSRPAIGRPRSEAHPTIAPASQATTSAAPTTRGAATVRSPSSAVRGLQRPSRAATGSCNRRATIAACARGGVPSCAMPSTAVAEGSRQAESHHGALAARKGTIAQRRALRARARPAPRARTTPTAASVVRDIRWVQTARPLSRPIRISRPRFGGAAAPKSSAARAARATTAASRTSVVGYSGGSADSRRTYADGHATRRAAGSPAPATAISPRTAAAATRASASRA